MRIISCHLQNFASYKKLDFTFDSQGLALVQGPTGAGKSTLCDIISWICWGRTAKDGAVDEVRSWGTKEVTEGRIHVETAGVEWYIIRTRGKNANDLFFVQNCVDERPVRGKDISDTQKHINQRLGMDFALYSSGAYFSEFSQTAQFFQTTAKNRRVICEQLVDLSLAKSLQTELSTKRKETTASYQDFTSKATRFQDKIEHLNSQYSSFQDKQSNLEKDFHTKKENLENQITRVTSNTPDRDEWTKVLADINKELEILEKHKNCRHCGSNLKSREITLLTSRQGAARNVLSDIKNKDTQVDSLLNQLTELKQSDYSGELEELLATIYELDIQQSSNSAATLIKQQELADIDLLLELIDALRGATIASTIQQLEDHTNQLLSNHFDAEIKVLFEVADADKLDVTILKDGNQATFTQLSKGQRCLLKLCFGVSVMKQVANRHGLSFNTVFFDEALDGLSDQLKVKAYGLLQTLQLDYSSIFVVEHSAELKSLFDKSFTVALIDGGSQIAET